MFKRRDIRIKALQSLYGFYTQDLMRDNNSKIAVNFYNTLIKENEKILICILNIIIQIADYSKKLAEAETKKILKNNIDINKTNTTFFNNSLIKNINSVVVEYENKNPNIKLPIILDEELIRKLFNDLFATELYIIYINNKNIEPINESEIVCFLLKEIIGTSEVIEDFLDSNFINANEDVENVLEYLYTTFNNHPKFIINDLTHFKTNINFGENLLKTTIEKTEYYDQLIMQKITHWEKERIVILDQLILKLALSEILYFEHIPLKVSINEYIDIAKDFSTEESRSFINGVLDNVHKQLLEDGKINKTGKGLL